MIKRMIFLVLVLLLGMLLTTALTGTESEAVGIHKAALNGDLAKVKTFLKEDARKYFSRPSSAYPRLFLHKGVI